jgi:predicted phosphoribosyltransferase
MFDDRIEAGKKLAGRLSSYRDQDTIVLAIPRGGVVVAAEVAGELGAPLDLIIPRKIGAPGNPELAIGAVAGEGKPLLNESMIKSMRLPSGYIEEAVRSEVEEIKRRRKEYLGDRPRPSLKGKTVIIIDDGLATGYTALAAVRSVTSERPAKVILAVPVAPRETVKFLEPEVDELIVLETPAFFYAVGQFYHDFRQVSDWEVKEILKSVTSEQ